jgi:hypothetical protein
MKLSPERNAIRGEYHAAKLYFVLLRNFDVSQKTSEAQMERIIMEAEDDLRTKPMKELVDLIRHVHWLQQEII